ncbi:MAG TPA: hypothetical protein VK524_11135, partial [Polyangiaceae bacterium]|nr:hypothetical protein [Polyangiaceae bacterium]
MLGEVIAASASDRNRIVSIFARAFETDPVLSWVVRKDAGRRAAFEQFFGANFDYYVWHARAFVSADAGAALWAPPHKWNMGTLREAWLFPTIVRVVSAKRLS